MALKSPLRYPGGKQRQCKTLLKHFPEGFKEYREPFIGGGSVFLSLFDGDSDVRYWINDLYVPLYVFYDAMINGDRDFVVNEVIYDHANCRDGREQFRLMKDVIENCTDIEEIAIAFFEINRMSFSGTTLSGGYSEMAFGKRFTPSAINRLIMFGNTLSAHRDRIKVTNYDYSEVVNADGEEVFIYLDPPYDIKGDKLYGSGGDMHKGFDHGRFAEIMKQCKHKWLISYNDNEYIRELFSFADITPVDVSYGMRNVNAGNIRQKETEIIIKNY